MNIEVSVECDSWDENEVTHIATECVREVFSEV
jgi:hypothetical protein